MYAGFGFSGFGGAVGDGAPVGWDETYGAAVCYLPGWFGVVGGAVAVIIISLDGVSIVTGVPTVPSMLINGSVRRTIHVSALSNNIAVVTDGPNYSIVSENTPNSVSVTAANEAA